MQCLRFLCDHGAIAEEPWKRLLLGRSLIITVTVFWEFLDPSVDPVLTAIAKCAVIVLESLFTLGYSPHHYYKLGHLWRTPLQFVSEHNKREAVQMLLSRGADVNASAHNHCGITALQGTASSGNLQLVLDLLKAGADINAPAAKFVGRTALENATYYGKLDIIHVLIANNKDPYRLREDCKRSSRLLKMYSRHGVTVRILDKHARKLATELGVEDEDEIDMLCRCELERRYVEHMCGGCTAKYSEAVEFG